MSSGFINQITSGITSFQQDSINDLLENMRRRNLFISREQYTEKQKEIAAKIKAGGMAFKAEVARERITSDYFNNAFDSIYVDLSTLYKQVGLLSSDLSKIKSITDSTFIGTRSSIYDLISSLRLYRFLKLNPEYQDAKFVSFNNSLNKTNIRPAAEVDKDTRVLKLPKENGIRSASINFDQLNVKGSVVHYGGGISNSDNESFGPDKALDDNPESFFADIVLSDAVPNHVYRLSHFSQRRRLGSGWQNGTTFESKGMIFEIKYKMSKTVRCNQIKLQPIADYGVRLIDLAYKTTDSGDVWNTVPGFNPLDYEETLDWIEWNGKQFHMVELKVVFEQQNATKNIYHIPSSLLKNNELWSQILSDTYQSAIHNIELDNVVSDKIAVNPKELTYLNELKDISTSIANISPYKTDIKEYDVNESIKKIILDHLSTVDNDPSSIVAGSTITKNTLVEVKKLQYVCGLRSIEVNNNTYIPFAVYESQKFLSNANLLELELETNEQHIEVPDTLLGEPHRSTSIDWEVEVGKNTRFPIAPYQLLDEDNVGNRFVNIHDEVLILNKKDNYAITRFPAYLYSGDIASLTIRKNGQRISPLVVNSTLGGQPMQYNYQTYINSNGSVKILFNSKYFDQRAVYTVSYKATEDASVLDFNELIDSDKTIEPEVYTGVDKDNKVTLKYYPYVEYQIVNDDTNWIKDIDVPKWSFIPSTQNYSIGTASITGSTLSNVTGSSTIWNNIPQNLLTGLHGGITGAAIMFLGDSRIYPISGIASNTYLTVYDPIETGFLPVGSSLTGLPYVIGKVTTIDGIQYGLNNVTYEPLEIYVDDVKAINRTNYNTLEHEAFIPSNESNRIYEYIQAGRNIYFNAPIKGKIEVNYRYLTEYIKINAILRSHRPVNALMTPIVKDYTVRIKNSKI